jgi:acyl carrier protein
MPSVDRNEIRNYIQTMFACDLHDVSDDDSLFVSGTIDSLSLLEILSFIERESGVPIAIEDLSIEDVDTLRSLAAIGHAARPL